MFDVSRFKIGQFLDGPSFIALCVLFHYIWISPEIYIMIVECRVRPIAD